MSPKPEITVSEWMAALEEAEQVPCGWFTRRELQRAIGKSQHYLSIHLRRLIRKGVVEQRHFRISRACGAIAVPHYHLVTR